MKTVIWVCMALLVCTAFLQAEVTTAEQAKAQAAQIQEWLNSGVTLSAEELSFLADYKNRNADERALDSGDNTVPDSCYCHAGLYRSGAIGLPIPDATGEGSNPRCAAQAWSVSHTITIPEGTGVVKDVNIYVNIAHPYIGDLVIQITHNNKTVKLLTRAATGFGESCNNIRVTFDDAGARWTAQSYDGTCNRHGCVHSYNPSRTCGGDTLLAGLNGLVADGEWTLTVSDNASADVGTLRDWAICLDAVGVDMGDLPRCYPTLPYNPAHMLSGIAWLGETVTGEAAPNSFLPTGDPGDDGVICLHLPWHPCQVETVMVNVHAGPHYASSELCPILYLSGWKDGNGDGDFCDTLCNGLAREWIVRDRIVTPGWHKFAVLDPGETTHGVYDGVFRWRLSSRPVGAFGFGSVALDCPDNCGNYAIDPLGEVEDYVLDDAQLDVQLASFTAVNSAAGVLLTWITASENNNVRFIVTRNDETLTRVNSLGDSPIGHRYDYTDNTVLSGVRYTYTLSAINNNYEQQELATRVITVAANPSLAGEYKLEQNYPNPFNPVTGIGFNLAENGPVTLQVFTPEGRLVATLLDRNLTAGTHRVSFDGSSLTSGLYFYRLTAGTFADSKKMLLVK